MVETGPIIEEINLSAGREDFFKLEWWRTSRESHISPTLKQTKGIEIGSLKTKTLINDSGRFCVIKCS